METFINAVYFWWWRLILISLGTMILTWIMMGLGVIAVACERPGWAILGMFLSFLTAIVFKLLWFVTVIFIIARVVLIFVH